VTEFSTECLSPTPTSLRVGRLGGTETLAATTLLPRPFTRPPLEFTSDTTREVDEDGGGGALAPSLRPRCLGQWGSIPIDGGRRPAPADLRARHPLEVAARRWIWPDQARFGQQRGVGAIASPLPSLPQVVQRFLGAGGILVVCGGRFRVVSS
jgi:hypothetical protein